MTEYERVNWEDLPSTETPLNADNLNVMDAGIAELYSELSSLLTSITDQVDQLDLLNRRYVMIWAAIEEFLQEHGGDGSSDPNAYPKTGGTLYGPLETSQHVLSTRGGRAINKAAFRAQVGNSWASFTAQNNSIGAGLRTVAFGISGGDTQAKPDGGSAGIYDDSGNLSDGVSKWILRATPMWEKEVMRKIGNMDYFPVTVNDFDVYISHPFFCKNWEFTEDSRPPILTAKATSIGNRISRMQTYGTGSGRIRVYGDFVDSEHITQEQRAYGWWETQGWTQGNQAYGEHETTFHLPAVDINVSSSDIRLKENVEDSNLDALDLLMSFRMRQFDWKQTGEHWDVGFVADEIEELDPNLASGGGYDEDGSMIIKTIDNLYLEGVITKALQQAVKRIEALEAEVAELKAKG